MEDKFGLDREIAQRREDKFDPEDEVKILDWIETVTTVEIGSLIELKTGVHLCLVIEAVSTGTLDMRKLNLNPKHYLEEHGNIQLFLNAAASLGVPSSDLFTLRDVGKNFDKTQIVQCIYALARQAQALGAGLPQLGVRYYKTVEQQRALEKKKEEERSRQAAMEAEISRERKQRREFLEVMKSDGESKKAQRTSAKITKRQEDRRSRGRHSLRERKSKKRDYDMDEGPVKFGVDLEHEEYMESKYLESSVEEEKCLDWIEEVTGEQVDDLYLHLKSGRTLCRMMNKFIPRTILKINYGHQEFHEMENIKNFLIACASFGIKQTDLFSVNDLYKKQNLALVIKTIQFLSDKLGSVAPSYKGPLLGGESKIGWDNSTADDMEEELYHEQVRQKRKQSNVKSYRNSDYYSSREDSPMQTSSNGQILCHCGCSNNDERTYCASCGEILSSSREEVHQQRAPHYQLPKRKPRPQNACPECSHMNDFDRVFCGDCGFNLVQPTQQSRRRSRGHSRSPGRRRKSREQQQQQQEEALEQVACPSCGSENDNDRTFCRDCGGRLSLPDGEEAYVPTMSSSNAMSGEDDESNLPRLQCPECAHSNGGGRIFCCECGSLLQPPTTIAIQPASPRRNREKRKSASPQHPRTSPTQHQQSHQIVCSCGHWNDNDRVFCGECGSNLQQIPTLAIPSFNLSQHSIEVQKSPRGKTPRKRSNSGLRHSYQETAPEEEAVTSSNNPFYKLHQSQPSTPRGAQQQQASKTPRKTSNHAATLAHQLDQQLDQAAPNSQLIPPISLEEPQTPGQEWKLQRRRSGSRASSGDFALPIDIETPSKQLQTRARANSRQTSGEYAIDDLNKSQQLQTRGRANSRQNSGEYANDNNIANAQLQPRGKTPTRRLSGDYAVDENLSNKQPTRKAPSRQVSGEYALDESLAASGTKQQQQQPRSRPTSRQVSGEYQVEENLSSSNNKRLSRGKPSRKASSEYQVETPTPTTTHNVTFAESQPPPVTIPFIKLHQNQDAHTLPLRKTPRTPRKEIEQQQRSSPDKTGIKTTPEKKPSPEKGAYVYCGACGSRNDSASFYCGQCGTHLYNSGLRSSQHSPDAKGFRNPENSPRHREPPSPRQPPLSASKRHADRRATLTPRSPRNVSANVSAKNASGDSANERDTAQHQRPDKATDVASTATSLSTSNSELTPSIQHSETKNLLIVFAIFSAIICVGSIMVISANDLNEDGSNPWVGIFDIASLINFYLPLIRETITNSLMGFGGYFNEHFLQIKETFFSSSL